MASLLHIAVGMAAGRYLTRRRDPVAMVAMAGLSMLPDADVLAFPLGIPYEAPLGHRGAAHSLVFALGTGSLCGLVARLRRKPWLSLAIVSVCVVASHPLLDAMTTGGQGVALAWPWSTERFFLPWTPIPVSPIGLDFLSRRGLEVVLAELLPSLPLMAYALWPSSAARSSTPAHLLDSSTRGD